MADPAPAATRGLLDSLSNVAGTLVTILQTRLSLLSADMEDGHRQFLTLLIRIIAALMGLGIGVILATIAVVSIYWDTHRTLALALLAGGYLLAGGVCLYLAVRNARTRPRIFAASLDELAKDRLLLTRR